MFDIKEFMVSLIAQPALISIIAGIFGEDYILFLMILSGTGIISFWKVVVFGFVGVLLHDTVVYLAGRYGFVDKFILRKKRKVRHKKKKDWILGLGKGGYILPMVISKFIYGTRV